MNKDIRCTHHFITSTSQQPVHCHGPAYGKTMLLNSLVTVFGTGWVHGTDTASDRGQVIQGAAIDTDKIFIRGRIWLVCGKMCTASQKKNADRNQVWSRYSGETLESHIHSDNKIPYARKVPMASDIVQRSTKSPQTNSSSR